MHAPPSLAPPRTSPRTALLLLALAVPLAACPIGVGGGGDFPENQWDATPLERDPACTLTGSLELALGDSHGTSEFKPLAPGQGPVVHFGPQGGSHLELGLRVANPARDFPGLQVRFLAEAQTCEPPMGCQPYSMVGELRTLVREPARFLPQEGDAVAVSGFIVFMYGWAPSWNRRLTVEALDRCGRMGTATLELAAGAP